MSSMHCFKPAQDTCQQKCSESCCGHKPNNGGTYYAGQSTALYGHTTFAPTGHNMVKPAMNHPSYRQTYGQPTMANPKMSYNSCGTHKTCGHHMVAAEPVRVGHKPCMDQVHGHSHGLGGQHALHGTASCHAKSHEKKKADHCKKKDKSLSKKKHKDCNRSHGSGTDSSDGDSD